MFKTKSVYSPISHTDGLRILATRYRGRGLVKSRYDVWMASLGPSEALFRLAKSDKISWGEFGRRYRREILKGDSFYNRNRTIKNNGQKFTLRLLQHLARRGTITLMCHCDEQQ